MKKRLLIENVWHLMSLLLVHLWMKIFHYILFSLFSCVGRDLRCVCKLIIISRFHVCKKFTEFKWCWCHSEIVFILIQQIFSYHMRSLKTYRKVLNGKKLRTSNLRCMCHLMISSMILFKKISRVKKYWTLGKFLLKMKWKIFP